MVGMCKTGKGESIRRCRPHEQVAWRHEKLNWGRGEVDRKRLGGRIYESVQVFLKKIQNGRPPVTAQRAGAIKMNHRPKQAKRARSPRLLLLLPCRCHAAGCSAPLPSSRGAACAAAGAVARAVAALSSAAIMCFFSWKAVSAMKRLSGLGGAPWPALRALRMPAGGGGSQGCLWWTSGPGREGTRHKLPTSSPWHGAPSGLPSPRLRSVTNRSSPALSTAQCSVARMSCKRGQAG